MIAPRFDSRPGSPPAVPPPAVPPLPVAVFVATMSMVVISAGLAGCGHASSPGVGTPAGASAAAPSSFAAKAVSEDVPAVTSAEIEGHLRALASDDMEGRAVATPGIEAAAVYHERFFKELGLEPAFGDSYRQRFTLEGSEPDPKAQVTFLTGKRTVAEPKLGAEFVLEGHRRDCEPVVEGDLVYVGYGIEAPGRDWDDIKGHDLRGKVLLMEVNEPGNRPGGPFEGTAMTYYGRWTYKFEQAHKLGAKGVLLIHDDVGATYGWSVVRNSWSNETFFLPSEPKTSCFHGWIDRGTAVRALKAVGKDRDALRALAEKPDFAPVDTGLAVRVRYKPTFRSVMAENVAGVIRGGAVSKDDRYVVLSAHYDHLGVDPSLKGDTIYNGAVDNAAASATLLALARRLAERSASLRTNVIILAPSAEEVGLLGSRAFVGDPPVPLDRMVANINLELVNVWGPTEDVFAIGAAESELDGVCARAAKAVGLGYIEEQGRENGFFFRSDQLSFARAGVPGVWLSEGPTDRGGGDRVARARKHYRESVYHTVGDQMSNDWDLRGAVELADWTEAIVDELGRGSSPPKFRPASAFAVSR